MSKREIGDIRKIGEDLFEIRVRAEGPGMVGDYFNTGTKAEISAQGWVIPKWPRKLGEFESVKPSPVQV